MEKSTEGERAQRFSEHGDKKEREGREKRERESSSQI